MFRLAGWSIPTATFPSARRESPAAKTSRRSSEPFLFVHPSVRNEERDSSRSLLSTPPKLESKQSPTTVFYGELGIQPGTAAARLLRGLFRFFILGFR